LIDIGAALSENVVDRITLAAEESILKVFSIIGFAVAFCNLVRW